jgi:hypothetical protein
MNEQTDRSCACGHPELASHSHSPGECIRVDLLDRLRRSNDMDLETARDILKAAATTRPIADALRRVFERIAELEAIELRIIQRGVQDRDDPAEQRLLHWLRTGVSLTCQIVVGPDFHSLTSCGQPATARWIDGATDETHYTCAAHEEQAEGYYERRPL